MVQVTPTDEESGLLERAQAGDGAAFEALVEATRDRVYGIALRITRSEADAAEVTQETFLSAYQHLGELRGSIFSAWIQRIAANQSLMRLRHRKVAESAQSELGGPTFNDRGSLDPYPASDWSRRADEKALDAELSRAIEKAAEALPDDYRRVFLLRDVEGLSYEEISEITGDTLGAIRSRLHRARLAMRQAIDDFYNGI
jgi:RNA polymerase sigma-70 factor (ECF subfamily)